MRTLRERARVRTDATSTDSAADAVMVRVQAYREIKNQIQCARDDQF